MGHIHGLVFSKKYIISLAIPTAGLLFLFFVHSQSPIMLIPEVNPVATDPCSGRYIYIYDLPTRFNSEYLHYCHTIYSWVDLCPLIENSGLGPPINDSSGVLPRDGWFKTFQFILEIIFHSRMKKYQCQTTNSSMAAAIYIPFYPGSDLHRHRLAKNLSERDSLSLDLVRWLKSKPEWLIHGGKDHFFVTGVVTYDYKRPTNDGNRPGNQLLLLPEIKNITVLTVESADGATNELAIPYPTYFHPSSERQLASWQETVRSMDRPWLFAFAGGRRNGFAKLRDHLIDQCAQSDACRLLECGNGTCHIPNRIIKLFRHSNFCLQPSGDTPTRRSTFDSILSGCIPVFFKPNSAYTQYMWHFPKNHTEYSVYIPEDDVMKGNVTIEEVLLKYSKEQVREMRETVISMIPRIVYKDPEHEIDSVKDAFDVAIDGVIERVKRLKAGGNH